MTAFFDPSGDRILVDVLPRGKSPGGIVLPDTAQDPVWRGTVLAVGPGPRTMAGGRVPIDACQVGDVVAFAEGTGAPVRHGGKAYLLLHETDVLGVVP